MVVGATGWQAQLHAYAFALAVETAVLLFVLAGHKRISYAFALATFATNLSYYAMAGVDLLSVQGAPAWLMSLLLPAAIMGYSHTIAERGGAVSSTTTPAEPVLSGPVAVQEQLSDTAPEPAAAEQPAVAVQPATPRPAAKRKTTRRKPAKLSAAQRQAQIASSGVTDPSAIVAQFGVSLRTAQADIAAVRSATLAQNGAQP